MQRIVAFVAVAVALVAMAQGKQNHRESVALIDSAIADSPLFDCFTVRGLASVGADPDSHGSDVLSVLLGLQGDRCPGWATRLTIHAVALSERPSAASVARALNAARQEHVSLANITAVFRRDDPTLRRAIAGAVRDGIVIVAAAGNQWGMKAGYPAAYPGVLSVGAFTSRGTLADFSAREGVNVVVNGDRVAVVRTGGAIAHVSGTSFAASEVSHRILRHMLAGADRASAVKKVLRDHGYEKGKK